jgi:hypothetical protein
MSGDGKKSPSPERIAQLRKIAHHLIEHPEDIPDAQRRGDSADLFGMLVTLLDTAVIRPLPDWMRNDPEMFYKSLFDYCRRYIEDNKPVPTGVLPYLAVGFCNLYKARQRRQGKPKPGKPKRPRGTVLDEPRRGTQAAGRLMALFVELYGFSPMDAAEEVSKELEITPESAVRAYRRWRKTRKPVV